MKLLMAFLIVVTGHLAQAKQTLHCEGGAGGPEPAALDVVIEEAQSGHQVVTLVLTNPNYPDGIKSVYVGDYDPSTKWLNARGSLNQIKSNIIVFPSRDGGPIGVALYAGGNDSIEFGFGAHLTCK